MVTRHCERSEATQKDVDCFTAFAKTETYENWSWPYPAALEWMKLARSLCLENGEMSIGVGSHAENIATLGRHASATEILDAERLHSLGVSVHRIDRGGGATLHGPGQVVLYPVVSLATLGLTVPCATHMFEQAMIDCLHDYHIKAHRIDGEPGVFVEAAKIGSVGLRVSQSVVTHGISLNVSNDLSLYSAITPCGKTNAVISSMTALWGENIDVRSVGRRLGEHLNSAMRSKLAPRNL